jgi:hypothetical protein
VDVNLIAQVRKVLEGIDGGVSPGATEQAGMTSQLELLIAAGSAPYREVVRMGRAFAVSNVTATAAVVAVPTTAVSVALYNNAPDGGRSLVIDWVGAQNVVSTAVATQAQLLVLVGQVREAAPTDAALAIKKLNGYGGGTADTVVRTIVGGTALPAATGIAANWFPFGPSVGKPGVAGTPGYGLWAAVDGRIIVPPGRYFAVQVIASVVGETFISQVGWHEVQLLLG